MKNDNLSVTIKRIIENDSRFHPDAYIFINDAVKFTIDNINMRADRSNRHISGKELLDGIKDFAMSKFGPMSYEVLSSWGLEDSLSIGYVVFNMVDYKLLGKSNNDSITDFDNSYNLREELSSPFLPEHDNIIYNSRPIDTN